MSYSATIRFKKIKADEIFDFFVKMKEHVSNRLDEVAEDDFIYSPYAKNKKKYDEDTWNILLREDVSNWARNSVFNFRYFYIKDLELLGLYGGPDCLEELFDSTLGFQNSCDQDYDFEYWDKVEPFKAIADKWRVLTPEQVYEEYSKSDYSDYSKEEFLYGGGGYRPAYYAKTMCYDEIWETYLEKTLYNESTIVYLSLFGYHDFKVLQSFTNKVKKLYDLFLEECKVKSKEKADRNDG